MAGAPDLRSDQGLAVVWGGGLRPGVFTTGMASGLWEASGSRSAAGAPWVSAQSRVV